MSELKGGSIQTDLGMSELKGGSIQTDLGMSKLKGGLRSAFHLYKLPGCLFALNRKHGLS